MTNHQLPESTGGVSLVLKHEHPWDLTPREGIALQRTLAELVELTPLDRPPATIAGVDMSVRGKVAQAAVVVVDANTLAPIASAIWREPVRFPYVSGLLSFREIPALLRALEQLPVLPDLIICDSQGIAHPRRIGLASHLGVLLDLPTIGAAKSRLFGTVVEPAQEAGAWTPLIDYGKGRNEVLGATLRTKTGVKPMLVSPGYKVTLADAIEVVLACTTRYRMPEPTRLAHLLSRDTNRQQERPHTP